MMMFLRLQREIIYAERTMIFNKKKQLRRK